MDEGSPGVQEGPTIRTVYDLFPDVEEHRRPERFPDLDDPVFWSVVQKARPYTMLSVEALWSIFTSVRYVAQSRIPGAFVECGVFLGGSVVAAAEFAEGFGDRERTFFLYDTFCGFPEGTAAEIDFQGKSQRMYPHPNFLVTTRAVIATSSLPPERFQFVPGDVARTLHDVVPDEIAYLRLDTDDYESTRAELEALYPRLSPGGVLIIDDYGHFRGARRATDEYFGTLDRAPLLHRVSYAVRVGVKPSN